jgi:hypothetical protein
VLATDEMLLHQTHTQRDKIGARRSLRRRRQNSLLRVQSILISLSS